MCVCLFGNVVILCPPDTCSCQFVVGESGDYSVNAMDPDVLVDWNLVEQVVSVNVILKKKLYSLPKLSLALQLHH